MKLEFKLYAEPPPREQVEAARKHQDRLLLSTIGSLFGCGILSAIIFFEFWDANPDRQSTYEWYFLGLGLMALFSIWRLSKVISGLMQLAEAHPETAPAFLACANSPTVKSYCASIIQQKRTLTMQEANLLMEQCKTREEILKLAAHYDAHGVWPEELGWFQG